MTRPIAQLVQKKPRTAPISPAAINAVAASDLRFSRVARLATIAALVLTAVVVDPLADAAFDAPKWLGFKWGGIVALVALLLHNHGNPFRFSRIARTAQRTLLMLTGALLCVFAAAFFSPHGILAWSSLAGLLVCALYLVIGASAAADGVGGKQILIAAIALGVVNAMLSLAQAAGLQLPLEVQRLGGRFATGALLGNEGFVALLCALMGACGVALFLSKSSASRTRALGVAITLLAVITIVVNRQATSAIALVLGALIITATRFGQRWIIAASAASIAVAVMCAATPMLRAQTLAALPGASVERYQQITTYRLGAWAAAEAMIRADPWLGQGPGGFARESTARRLDAEIAHGVRFVQPTGATFVYAHMDLLQFAAECGVPAAILVLAAFAMTFRQLLARCGSTHETEPLLLLGVSAAGLVSSLAWFPFQIPITAIALLLVIGRMWRLGAHPVRQAE
jgi:O-antigen ligase